jgi:murein DD-endopeptidase MepM/ murein hydrolase activator NlpD
MKKTRLTVNFFLVVMVLAPFVRLEGRHAEAASYTAGFRSDLLLNARQVSLPPDQLRLLDRTVICDYSVKPHDTLWSIQKKFNVDVDTIRSSNGLDVISLPPGRVLHIPNHRGMVYQSKAGENLEAIRRNFVWGKRQPGAFIETVLAMNGFPRPDLKAANRAFAPGTMLFLPNTFIDYHQLAIPLIGAFRRTSGFGLRLHPILGIRRRHDGWDLAKPYGSPVVAAREGKVIFTGWSEGYGNLIVLQHSIKRKNGYNIITTRYGHLSKILVESGQRVRKGQLIGKVGSTGISTGPHLHFEIRDSSGHPRNPWNYLQ